MATVPRLMNPKFQKPKTKKRNPTMANTAVSANRLELLQIADAVAREKSIDKSVVLEAMEDAMTRAAKQRYGMENEIRAEIDSRTGETRLNRLLQVAEVVENDATQISLREATKKNPAAQVGDYIAEPLPPIEFGRIAAQSAKQVIVQKVRDAERDRMFEEYKDRIGEIVNGTVKRAEYGNVIVDLGRGEGIVRRDEALPRETFRPGDRIRAYVYDVRREQRGPQIFLSRTHPQFMAKLFGQEVPEIYDGVVEVVSVARDPGSRAKIGVRSKDGSIDPVGACVGMRGSRVQAVVNELQGEKIDIIQWSPDVATFVVNALAPAEVAKVVLDEDVERIEVVVPDEQLSLAIGRRGQNVRLASQLTGWDIDIMTEAEESERRQKEFATRTKTFVEALDVDETLAQLLASEGFSAVEELVSVDAQEIASIDGLDDATAEELQSRANAYLEKQAAEFEEKRLALGVQDDLAGFGGLTPGMLVALGEAGVKSLEDFADLATDDLTGWNERKNGETVKHKGAFSGLDVTAADAEAMIMAARVQLGWIEAPVEAEVDVEAEAEADA
jgi:transcription termination/antitermination protein NusA